LRLVGCSRYDGAPGSRAHIELARFKSVGTERNADAQAKQLVELQIVGRNVLQVQICQTDAKGDVQFGRRRRNFGVPGRADPAVDAVGQRLLQLIAPGGRQLR
jgi:hypothetical protein